MHLIYECTNKVNKKKKNDVSSCPTLESLKCDFDGLTQKLINSTNAILNDTKNFSIDKSYEQNKNKCNSKARVILDEYNETFGSELSKIKKQETSDSNSIFDNNNISKPSDETLPSEKNSLLIEPIPYRDKINPIVFTQKNMNNKEQNSFDKNETKKFLKNENEIANNIKSFYNKNNENLNNIKSQNNNKEPNNKKILFEEINIEHNDYLRKNNSNIYNNKENLKSENNEEAIYDADIFKNNFFPDKNANLKNHKHVEKKRNNTFKDASNITKKHDDFPDYHLLQNFNEDIIFDDEEILRVIEKSKLEK